MIKYIAAILTTFVLVSAAPALAGPGSSGLDLSVPRLIFDQDCTDLYDVPATTVNVDLTTTANWDTVEEAINPDLNKHDAPQTSGSPDGWCDSTPVVIKGSLTIGAVEDLWIGPLRAPGQGFYQQYKFDTVVTNYSTDYMIQTLWDPGVTRAFALSADGSSTAVVTQLVGPGTEVSSQIGTFETAPLPRTDIYLVIDLNGAGAWAFNFGTIPAIPYRGTK